MALNTGIIPGSQSAINEAISRRGIGLNMPSLSQQSSSMPSSSMQGSGMSIPSQPPQQGMPPQPKSKTPMDHASVIIGALTNYLKKIPTA